MLSKSTKRMVFLLLTVMGISSSANQLVNALNSSIAKLGYIQLNDQISICGTELFFANGIREDATRKTRAIPRDVIRDTSVDGTMTNVYKTEFVFDDKARVEKVLTLYWNISSNGFETAPSREKSYEYDANDSIVKETYKAMLDGVLTDSIVSRKTFTTTGKFLTEVNEENLDFSGFPLGMKIIDSLAYSYNSNGNINGFIYVDFATDFAYAAEYVWNAAGDTLNGVVYKIPVTDGWLEIQRMDITYGEDIETVIVTALQQDAITWENVVKKEYLTTSFAASIWVNDAWRDSVMVTYTIDPTDSTRYSAVDFKEWNSATTALEYVSKQSYTFNAFSLMESNTIQKYASGAWVNDTLIEYTYTTDLDYDVISLSVADGDGWSLRDRYTYHYGVGIDAFKSTRAGAINTVVKTSLFQTVFNVNTQKPLTLAVYTVKGQLITKLSSNNGTFVWNHEASASGKYIYSITDGFVTTRGTLIK